MSYGTVIREIDLGLRHPQLGPFLMCIFGGKMFEGNGIDFTNMVETYIEHYLVWTGRIAPSEVLVPVLETVLDLFFNVELNKSVRVNRFAVAHNQRLALVPAHANGKHLFCDDYGLGLSFIESADLKNAS
jgi:hypothetical protein